MVAVNDFSGLTSSACALARAEASAATDSLDRCMDGLRREDIETHCPRFRTLGPHPMPDSLTGVLRHQGLEFALGPLVLEKSLSGIAEQRCEHGFRPLHDAIQGGRHPRNGRMPDPALHVADLPAGIALVPGAIELLGCSPELYDEVAREVFPRGLAAFLAP